MRVCSVGGAFLAIALLFLGAPAWAQPQVTTLYTFTGGADGAYPCSGVVADESGALYGSTQTGQIFRLAPPTSGGAWVFSVLYTPPQGSVAACIPPAMDSSGAIYSTLQLGRNSATYVFKLTPPPGGGAPWERTIIHRLKDSKQSWGIQATALVWSEQAQALFGTTAAGGDHNCQAEEGFVGCGEVYKLSPPTTGTEWQEEIVHRFHGLGDGTAPAGPIALRSDGAVFGTTIGYNSQNYGTIYRLTPPGAGSSQWQFKVLHTVRRPPASIYDLNGLLFDRSEQTLFVSALAGGSKQWGAFGTASPPASGDGQWNLVVRHNFGPQGSGLIEPNGYLALDPDGAVYATVYSEGGGIFKMTPPAAGQTQWRYSVVISGNLYVTGALVIGADRTIYAASLLDGTSSPNCNSIRGCGTIFQVTQ